MLSYRVEIYYTNQEAISFKVKGQANLLLMLQQHMNDYTKHVAIAIFKDSKS